MLRSLSLAGSMLLLAPIAGAIDLNVPDTYPTIQAAVDAAQAGDVILIEKGKYDTASIVGRTDLTLKRSGGGKVVIEMDGDDDAGIRILNSSGISIFGLEVRGGFGEGIWATSSSDVLIEKCRFRKTADGIALGLCTDVTIRDCRMDSPQSDGVYISGGSGVTIVDCVVKKAKEGPAIYSSAATTVTITGLRATNVEEGIYLSNAAGSLVADCRISKVSQYYGIEVGGDGVTVSDNVVKKAKNDGGIEVSGDGVTVEGNVVQKSSYGIEVGGMSSLIQGNVCKGCGEGIRVDGSGQTISGNRVTGSKQTGLLVDSYDSALDANKVMKNGLYGLEVDGTGNTVTGNTGKKNKKFDLYDDTSSGANTYLDNKFKKISIADDEIQ